MNIEIIEKLKCSPLFHGCNMDDVAAFLKKSPHQILHKQADDYIARRGDDCTNLTMVVEGQVCTSASNQDGKELIIDTYTGPFILVAGLIFSETTKYPVNAVAQTECTILHVDRATFIGWLHSDKQMMYNFINIISNRCQHLGCLLYNVGLLSLKERVTEYLKVHKKIKNVEALSRFMGVARTSLSRVLSEMKAEGMIERTTEGIVLIER